MPSERPAFDWSLPLGTWFATPVRLSILFILFIPILWIRLGTPQPGLTVSALLLLSVILHELGHLLAARMTGGDCEMLSLSPVGGLIPCIPAPTRQSYLWTIIGGPLANAVVCLSLLSTVSSTSQLAACLWPFDMPDLKFAGTFSEQLVPAQILLFKINWTLLLINLLPVYPLDGGLVTQLVLVNRFDEMVARAMHAWLGFIVGCILTGIGFCMGNTWLMALGAVVIVLNPGQSLAMPMDDDDDDSFDEMPLGYDFSEGFTSFERSAPRDESEEQSSGLIDKWKNQREEERRRRQEQEDREMELRLDALLEKLHQNGEAGLTAAEKRQLQKISAHLRNRGQAGS